MNSLTNIITAVIFNGKSKKLGYFGLAVTASIVLVWGVGKIFNLDIPDIVLAAIGTIVGFVVSKLDTKTDKKE